MLQATRPATSWTRRSETADCSSRISYRIATKLCSRPQQQADAAPHVTYTGTEAQPQLHQTQIVNSRAELRKRVCEQIRARPSHHVSQSPNRSAEQERRHVQQQYDFTCAKVISDLSRGVEPVLRCPGVARARLLGSGASADAISGCHPLASGEPLPQHMVQEARRLWRSPLGWHTRSMCAVLAVATAQPVSL